MRKGKIAQLMNVLAKNSSKKLGFLLKLFFKNEILIFLEIDGIYSRYNGFLISSNK